MCVYIYIYIYLYTYMIRPRIRVASPSATEASSARSPLQTSERTCEHRCIQASK